MENLINFQPPIISVDLNKFVQGSKFGSLSVFFSFLWMVAYASSVLAVRPLVDSCQPFGDIIVYALIFTIILCPLLGISYGLVAGIIKKEKNKKIWKTGLALSLVFLFFVAYLRGTNTWL